MATITEINNQLNQLDFNTQQVNFQKAKGKLGSSDIGKDGFLQLMLTQLKLQNPLEPQDSSQQLLQQASFTQIEELQKLNTTLSRTSSLSEAASFVGKNITYKAEGGVEGSGRVDRVSFADNALVLHVNGKTIGAADVKELFASGT